VTPFDKSKFTFDGMFLEYEGKFIARFKYVRSNVSAFRTFLIKNFTVEEFFERRAREEAPLDILNCWVDPWGPGLRCLARSP